jgi:hypothetical protein
MTKYTLQSGAVLTCAVDWHDAGVETVVAAGIYVTFRIMVFSRWRLSCSARHADWPTLAEA